MRRVGQTRKRDRNEGAIIEALEAIGVTVFRISGVGCPDLLCHARGVWLPMEVKAQGGSLTTAQIAARATAPYPVVHSVAEAIALFGVQA